MCNFKEIKEVMIMADRKARMTDRQRVEAMLRHEKPDRVPIWPCYAQGFACVYTGTSIADAYNKPAVSLAAQRKTAQDFGWVYWPGIAYASYGAWEFGGDIKWPSGEWAQAPSVVRFPVQTEDDVWKLEAPKDVSKVGIVPLQTEFLKLAAQERLDNEPFNIYAFEAAGPFNTSGMIASPEKLCKWVLKKPEVAHRLLRLATDHMKDMAQYWFDLFGAEGALPMTGEAVGTNDLISAKQFEEFVMPYFQEAHRFILSLGYKHIWSHICGEQNDDLPYWAQVPFGDPGFISIGHEVELETMGKYFPNDIIIGNLEPAIIQTRTPDEVYEAAKKNIADGMAKCPGGYIFSPGCELPPMSPIENVKALTRAVNDAGWYE
jgi:uroporphyrinogen decarboxylase